LFVSTPAWAPFIEQSYEDFAGHLQLEIDEAAQALDLTILGKRRAESLAGAWVYFGPCKGSSNDLPDRDAFGVFQALANAKVTRRHDTAALVIIALINRDNLGRGSERVCRFAKEKASQPIPAR
jgi:hypothetical protein